MMKYRYEFMNGDSVEVEVTEDMLKILIREDMDERNVNQRETRRHVTIDHTKEEDWMASSDKDPDHMIKELIREGEIKERRKRIKEAFASLTKEEKELVDFVYKQKKSQKDFAELKGISAVAIFKRKKKIIEKLKKVL